MACERERSATTAADAARRNVTRPPILLSIHHDWLRLALADLPRKPFVTRPPCMRLSHAPTRQGNIKPFGDPRHRVKDIVLHGKAQSLYRIRASGSAVRARGHRAPAKPATSSGLPSEIEAADRNHLYQTARAVSQMTAEITPHNLRAFKRSGSTGATVGRGCLNAAQSMMPFCRQRILGCPQPAKPTLSAPNRPCFATAYTIGCRRRHLPWRSRPGMVRAGGRACSLPTGQAGATIGGIGEPQAGTHQQDFEHGARLGVMVWPIGRRAEPAMRNVLCNVEPSCFRPL